MACIVGELKVSPVSILCYEQGLLAVDQAAQSSIS